MISNSQQKIGISSDNISIIKASWNLPDCASRAEPGFASPSAVSPFSLGPSSPSATSAPSASMSGIDGSRDENRRRNEN